MGSELTPSADVQVLADNGTWVLADHGGRLLFLHRRILPSWSAFVPALLAVIAIGNGALQLVLGHLAAGAVLVVIGLLAALGLRTVLRSRREAVARPLDPSVALLVLDPGAGALLDGAGQLLAPLASVRVERSVQATSSARALRVAWPGGAAVVYRGDPMVPAGSIDGVVQALRERGIAVTG